MRTSFLLSLGLLLIGFVSSTQAQIIINREAGYDPTSARIRAEGSRLRNFGLYLESVANAQKTAAETERLRIENRLIKVKTDFEIRNLRWEQKERELDQHLESKMLADSRRSEVIQNLPKDANAAAGGSLLNDILDRLERNSISSLISNTQPLDLPPKAMDEIRILQGTGSERAKLVLQGQGNYACEPPRDLTREPFKPLLDDFLKKRQTVLELLQQGKAVNNEAYDASVNALNSIADQINEKFTGKKWTNYNDPDYQAWKKSKAFLADQYRQIGLFGVLKKLPAPFAGKTVQDLVIYMKQNGYRFAPADPTGSGTYDAMFKAMRDLLKESSAGEKQK